MLPLLLLSAFAAPNVGFFERDFTAADGLGPRFNASSCATCHQQGGVGGAGGKEHDVFTLPSGMVVHAESLEDDYDAIRESLMHPTVEFHEGMCGTGMMRMLAAVTPTQRQTPALFGLSALDQVADEVLVRQVRAQAREGSEVSGRIARDAEGRAGRFGWKAQSASLTLSVSRAAENELGLTPDELTRARLAALVAEVRAFAAPETTDHPGAEVFDAVGCTSCHLETLGEVEGAYTDLLVHDMGHRLADAGAGYGVVTTDVPDAATALEWRTPPLWGVALSAPYLHDGRAPTLNDAVLAHGGEAQPARDRFTELDAVDQAALLGFLGALR